MAIDPLSTVAAVFSVLSIFDTLSGQIRLFLKKEPEPPQEPPYAVMAEQETREKLVVRREGQIVEQITANDLGRLDENSRHLIEAFEKSMQSQYDIWVTLYPKRDASPDPKVNAHVEAQLREAAERMCADLEKIMRFLDQIGKSLEDHYAHVQFICQELRAWQV